MKIKIFYSVCWIGSLIVFLVGFLNYQNDNGFTPDFGIIKFYFIEYPYVPFLITLVLLFFVVVQYKYYKTTLDNRQNCQIQFIELEKIASDWLDKEEVTKNLEEALKDQNSQVEKEILSNFNDIINLFLSSNVKNKDFLQNYITPHIQTFSDVEINIILKLLELLEDNKDLPSVATIFKDDSDKKVYSKAYSADNKTKYEILREVSLLDHTLHVVDFSIQRLRHEHRDNFIFFLPRVIIIALAHDIGKIVNIKKIANNANLDELIYKQNTHEKVTKFILDFAFGDYEYIDEINDAVLSHHVPHVDSLLGSLLKDADHEARELELKEYTSRQLNTLDINLKDEPNEVSKQNELLKKQMKVMFDEKNEIEEKSKKDALTRALNRAEMDRCIEEVFDINKNKYLIAFVDADKFKNVNDTYGHAAGDEVLKSLVNLMYVSIRDSNAKVFRYGGEEFCIVFEKALDQKITFDDEFEKNVLLTLENIRVSIESHTTEYKEHKIQHTVSMGVSRSMGNKDFKELIEIADKCVYNAKETGRNKIVIDWVDQPIKTDNEPVTLEQKNTNTNKEPVKKSFDDLMPNTVHKVNKKFLINEDKDMFVVNDEALADFFTGLASCVNKTEILRASGKNKILSISDDNKIYFFMQLIKKLMKKHGISQNVDKDFEQFIDYLKEQKIVLGNSVGLTFKGGNASIVRTVVFGFYAFDAESLGYSAHKLNLEKRDNPEFRNITITIK